MTKEKKRTNEHKRNKQKGMSWDNCPPIAHSPWNIYNTMKNNVEGICNV
jgi:hypothetical protein